MPSLTIFRKFTTRPFGGDDLQIACLILLLYRAIQLICLIPLAIHMYLDRIRGNDIYVNDVPPWCDQYHTDDFLLLFTDDWNLTINHYIMNTTTDEQVAEEVALTSFRRNNFGLIFVFVAIVYFAADITWICMVWSASSLGTPTVTTQRDTYLRRLIIFKMFLGNFFPLLLLGFGLWKVSDIRKDNYGCGEDNPTPVFGPDEDVLFVFLSILLVTYALELLVWPTIVMNHVIRVLRSNSYVTRHVLRTEESERRAERYENCIGMILRCLQCLTCNTKATDFRNKGELKEYAKHFMDLMNYNTKFDIVMSDMYIGLHMLSRYQLEEKVLALKRISVKSKFMRHMLKAEEERLGRRVSDLYNLLHLDNSNDNDEVVVEEEEEEDDDPFYNHRSAFRDGIRGRQSMFVLCANESSTFDLQERDVLTTFADELRMKDAATYAKYAQVIYHSLRELVNDEFTSDEHMTIHSADTFIRQLDTLYQVDFTLEKIGCERSMLCYANFVNGIAQSPYAIIVDEETKSVVLTIRGTLSVDDMVIDFQYNPVSLKKAGKVCGFAGEKHFCHAGFLTRCKWLYNDIKEKKILKTLFSDSSPYKDYPLIVCGHSLGAGCACVLSVMLRPMYHSLKCFAYCPPGAVFNEDMCKICDHFITCIVRQDDLIPRMSHQSFEAIRDDFLSIIVRIKIPKIQAFFDVRQPCTDSAIAERNAKVLHKTEDIPQNTSFYNTLQTFRVERAVKYGKSATNYIKLFIPGKIIHLVDSKGDNSDYASYVPYYGNRYEDFNLIVSKRMTSDHSMLELVDILKEVRLDHHHSRQSSVISASIYASMLVSGETEYEGDNTNSEDEDTRLFMWWSNPYGNLPLFLIITNLAALVCSVLAITRCTLFTRKSEVLFEDETILDIPFSVGLFSYTLLTCLDDRCDSADDTVVPTDYCIPYPDGKSGVEMNVARGSSFFVIMFGGLCQLLLCISTCFPIKRKMWGLISCLLLLTSLLQGLIFLVKKSSFCVQVIDEDGMSVDSSCKISSGAVEAITAASLYFLTAILSMSIARRNEDTTTTEPK